MVIHIQEIFPNQVSQRRACKVLGQSISTQRYCAHKSDYETALVQRIIELAKAYGRYGYRNIMTLLEREGWHVNHKRIERIWKQEGLKVPARQPRRRRLWLNDGSCVKRRADHKNHVWSYDFVMSRSHDGRVIKILAIMDEYTRDA